MLYTVGFYDPAGNWHSESDHDTRDEAAARVAYLNGEIPANCVVIDRDALDVLQRAAGLS